MRNYIGVNKNGATYFLSIYGWTIYEERYVSSRTTPCSVHVPPYLLSHSILPTKSNTFYPHSIPVQYFGTP